MSVQTGKPARLEVRLSVQEREAIEAKAQSLGMSLSDYVRLAALGFSTGQQVPEPAAAVIAQRLQPPSSAVQPPGDQTQRYRCPVTTCDFTAPSRMARCPLHARVLV